MGKGVNISVQSIIGFSKTREENDFYPTPPEATHALFKRETFVGDILEPACGNGMMSEVIKQYNSVTSFDLINRGYGAEQDFLQYSQAHTNIITNPPYKIASEFVNHAKLLASKKVAMLLKLVFLESSGRYKMFQDKDFPLKCIYVFCKRLQFGKGGSPTIASAWFVWDKGYIGKPYVEWIN